ncbi:Uma2 family endonuclease [Chroococcidiopsis sp. CCMEE 29]|uniref:Uma2 family endonuclease n=1 Tax=Chroococcidiopsis sp. CCMEE 29 TaxID=155894 RepID=UPI002022877E|nr:Uma2 family endonuclease [Chroococcidiopsis sp. CCMEE 29]
METTRAIAEQRVVFHHVSWQTFKALLVEIGEDRTSRLTYDQGTLEIMTPLMPHEQSNRLIERLIYVLVEEMELDLVTAGSTTLDRPDLERGAEPDSSYYIQNEALMRDREEIDLTQDPPPDLVLEVEYSRSSVDKLRLYASMGVPEFWRYNGHVLRIYRLDGEQYQLCENSPTFTPVAVSEIPRFIEEAKKIGEVAMIKSFRAWVRQ